MAKKSHSSKSLSEVAAVLNDKTIKAKAKTAQISQLLLDGAIKADELIPLADIDKKKYKATLIEAMEYASKISPGVVSSKSFQFVIDSLKDELPRVKWESAKVISKTAHLYPEMIQEAVGNLLENTVHDGTVVRWSAAGALSTIIQFKTSINKDLIPAIEAILRSENDNAIKKIYHQGLKKATK